MNQLSCESFIAMCDELYISDDLATEGFCSTIKKGGAALLATLKKAWDIFIQFLTKIKNKVKGFIKKHIGAEDEEKALKEKIHKLKNEMEQIKSDHKNELNSEKSKLEKLNNQNQRLHEDLKESDKTIEKLRKELEYAESSLNSYRKSYNTLEYLDSYIDDIIIAKQYGKASKITSSLKVFQKMLDVLKSIPIDESADFVRKTLKSNHMLYDTYILCPDISDFEEADKEYIDTFREKIKSARYSSTGRIQNAFVLKQIEKLESYVKCLEKIKKSAESFIKEGDSLQNKYARDQFMLSMSREISEITKSINNGAQFISALNSLLNHPEAINY